MLLLIFLAYANDLGLYVALQSTHHVLHSKAHMAWHRTRTVAHTQTRAHASKQNEMNKDEVAKRKPHRAYSCPHTVRLSYYVTYRFSLGFPFSKHDTHLTVLLRRHRCGVDMSNKFVVRKHVHYNCNALPSILILCVRIECIIIAATACTIRFQLTLLAC